MNVSHNLTQLSHKIDMIPTNIQEAISRCFMDSYEQLKNELKAVFGDAIDYADFEISFNGGSYYVYINNINEFVTMNQTGYFASDIAQYAEKYITDEIQRTLQTSLFGGS